MTSAAAITPDITSSADRDSADRERDRESVQLDVPQTQAAPDSAIETDEALMSAWIGGDASAFDRLYARYRGPIYRFFLRQLSPGAADECFQDTWLKVIHRRATFDLGARLSAWLFTIARNVLIDRYRHDAVRPVEALVDEPLDAGSGPERLAQHAELGERLLALLHALPGEQRQTLLLRQEGGLSVADVAAVTGVPIETTRSRLRYALRKLREGMSQDEY